MVSSLIEVGIEDTDLGNAINGQMTSPCGLSDSFRRGPIVDAIGLLFILTHIRMDPGDLIVCIVAHDGEAGLCSHLIHRNDQPIWKGSFNDIAWHRMLLF